MAGQTSDTLGAQSDEVVLTLGSDRIKVSENYHVKTSILTQPGGFSLRCGHAGVARDLFKKYPPRTEFKLSIGGVPLASGITEGYESDETSGGTEVNFVGKDWLSPLHDAHVRNEVSLKETTFVELVKHGLREVGLGDRFVAASNDANRTIRSGVHVSVYEAPRTLDEIIQEPTGHGTVIQTIQAKLGQRWYDGVIKPKLDAAGLMLWADTTGNFILSAPNANQPAIYRIVRWRGKNPNAVNATKSHHMNRTEHRHSEVLVHARAGNKQFGRTHCKGQFADKEMLAWGYDKPLSLRDTSVHTVAQAEFLAKRKLAEGRRAGWQLIYTMAGHTTPSLLSSSVNAVWANDAVVEVIDDEYGIEGNFWIDDVDYTGAPRETRIVLMRKEDLLFGADEE